jgi:biotin transporter BioY
MNSSHDSNLTYIALLKATCMVAALSAALSLNIDCVTGCCLIGLYHGLKNGDASQMIPFMVGKVREKHAN